MFSPFNKFQNMTENEQIKFELVIYNTLIIIVIAIAVIMYFLDKAFE